MSTWRLLDLPPLSAAENMALDEALVELKGRGEAPNTLRFLQFSPPAVLVGYHQAVEEEVRLPYCRACGIHINRRITGGGAIFFDEPQLGWEVISEKAFFGVAYPTPGLFRRLCVPVILALRRLGIEATFRPRNDIEVRGRKISGTGGTESGDAFLFQGTLLTDFDVETMLRALRIPVEKLKAKEIDSVKERVTCLCWELGRVPPLEEVKEAIRWGFEQHLGIRLEPAGLTALEEQVMSRKLEIFQSEAWINAVQPRPGRREVVQAAYKGEGGLVRFTAVVDLHARRLRDLTITGDFISFPPRALRDMEGALRGERVERMGDVIQGFFRQGRLVVPGMGPGTFMKTAEQLLAKVAVAGEGLSLEQSNLVSVTHGSFREVLQKGPTVLLLPYCAKELECDLRHERTCRACGGCSFGEAWELGASRGMEVVSINSFEDLMEELGALRKAGTSAFIGCCCQPFFTKHVDDFEAAGVPGILLDIDDTTCYELDQAREAYSGQFASQTSINLPLLARVLDLAQEASEGMRRP